MQNVMMVGAGAVGGVFGAQLARNNPHVSFLLRPRTLKAVREQGLTIRSANGTFTVRPPAASDPRDLPTPDLIILSVKVYDLDEVLRQIEPVMTEQTILLTLQNGVDVEDRIIARFQRDCVVGGVAYIYSKIDIVFETVNRHLAKHGVHVPFPSIEDLMLQIYGEKGESKKPNL